MRNLSIGQLLAAPRILILYSSLYASFFSSFKACAILRFISGALASCSASRSSISVLWLIQTSERLSDRQRSRPVMLLLSSPRTMAAFHGVDGTKPTAVGFPGAADPAPGAP